MHTSLQLQRPPLAHPTVLAIPPNLSVSTTDQLHRLLFERLLVPQLLVSTRPFFASGAAGILSGIVVDIGYRGEGTEISAVHENQLVESASGFRLTDVDEGICDDYCAYRLLEADPSIERQLLEAKRAAANDAAVQFSRGEFANCVRRLVGELKINGAISFESPLLGKDISQLLQLGIQQAAGEGEEGEEGTLDVAKAIVEGKVDEIVRGKGTKGGPDGQGDEDDRSVRVANPYAPAASAADSSSSPHATIRIGPARHRYLEPLFFPAVLSCLSPSSSSSNPALAKSLFGDEYERFSSPDAPSAGLHEAVGIVLSDVSEEEVRNAVSEAMVVVSSGRIANNRGEFGPCQTCSARASCHRQLARVLTGCVLMVIGLFHQPSARL